MDGAKFAFDQGEQVELIHDELFSVSFEFSDLPLSIRPHGPIVENNTGKVQPFHEQLLFGRAEREIPLGETPLAELAVGIHLQ
jgi:hypothetical protein